MAKVRYGPIVADVSGTLGTIVFQSGRANGIARRSPSKVTKYTAKTARRKLAVLRSLNVWSDMTDGERQQWHTQAKKITVASGGTDRRFSSGRALFLSEAITFERSLPGQPIALPTSTSAQFFSAASIAWSGGDLDLTYSQQSALPNGWCQVQAARSFSYSGWSARSYRVIFMFRYQGQSPKDLTSVFVDQFGACAVGELYSLRVRIHPDGGIWSLPWTADAARIS